MEVNISKIATNPVGAAKGSQSNTASDEDLLANSKNATDASNNEQILLLNKAINSGSSSSHLSSLDQGSFDHVIDTETCQQKLSPSDENKWQILEGLKVGQRFEDRPLKFAGYILKRRKRPLKGWHKRYFCLDNGRLSYAKSVSDITKGKTHGSIDVGLSVISTKTSSRRIDIDSEYYIFHLKVKKLDNFMQWVNALKKHRLARQHEINYGTCLNSNPDTTAECDNGLNDFIQLNHKLKEKLSSDLLATKFNEVDINDDLFRLQEKLIKLGSLLKLIEVNNNNSVVDLEGFKYKKPRRRFHLRKKKSNVSKSVDQVIDSHPVTGGNKDDQVSLRNDDYLSLSHPSLTEEECGHGVGTQTTTREVDDTKPLSKTEAMAEFIHLANQVNSTYRELLKSFQEEKAQRLKKDVFPKSASLDDWNCKRINLMNRNSSIDEYDEPTFHQNVSRYSQDDSSVLSMSEYYDAEDKMSPSDYNSSTSEEEDDDESVITDFSEEGLNFPVATKVDDVEVSTNTGRRSKLPSVQPSSDISLWSLLTKNIGKDLSKISMPVTINEPLNVLQRLCEELEYCELLDTAATVDDPLQRMLLMAAFAVSAYSSSSHRAGHKPFNPLLGETYECLREDKGFRFVAEQTSHHPPISACYAESKNFIFSQDLRVKSKFWGKSMEVIPSGTVYVTLKPVNCHYKWNKITTCVHNLFKGERYVDNYGELIITDSCNLTCKITFEKAGYWSNKKNEISGLVMNKGEVVEKIFGRWNESIHCGTPPATRCIWRPGAMPENYQDYYGFSRFAIELNELTESDRPHLPPTDTRLRPDQRLLEQGDVRKAEAVKLELEQAQRDRRRNNEAKGIPEYTPLWFRKEPSTNNEETFVFNGKYWDARENTFTGIDFVHLW